jgi:hypothetical protein
MKLGSDHSEQDCANKSKRGEDGYYVNPAGEIHVTSPLRFELALEAASRQVSREAENHPKV